jgi:hypothetical protein
MQQSPSQSENAQSVTSELKADAEQIGTSAKQRVHQEVDARKGEAATQAKSVSSAMQRAAGELDEGAPEWLKSAFRQGADQIQRFADAIEQKDSRELFGDVQSFARQRPAAFLAACAAAGFAAARVFKAGGDQENATTPQQSRSSFPSDPSYQPVQADPASARGEFA